MQASMDAGSTHAALRRVANVRGPKPASISTRVPSPSTSTALPLLPVPSIQTFNRSAPRSSGHDATQRAVAARDPRESHGVATSYAPPPPETYRVDTLRRAGHYPMRMVV